MPSRVVAWRCRALASLVSKAKSKESAEGTSATAATFPPNCKDIACKPLLFDLAFPCIEPPDLDEILPKNASSGGADGEKKGLIGGAKGLIGGVAGGIGSRLGGLWGRK